jgi:polysaccharide biosynthesis transport protein
MADASAPVGAGRHSWVLFVSCMILSAAVAGAVSWLLRPERAGDVAKAEARPAGKAAKTNNPDPKATSSVAVTALFQVESTQPSVLEDRPVQPRENDFAIFTKTQVALLKSKLVLDSALRNPSVRGLSVFASSTDPVEWLQDNLEVGFAGNSEILSITLRGPKAQAQELTQIVDAVAAAYKKEVIDSERSRQLAQRDQMERSLNNLSAELKRKYEDYLDIAKGMGREDASGSDIELQLAAKQLDRIDAELMQLEREQWKLATTEEAKDSKSSAANSVRANTARMTELRKRQTELRKEIQGRTSRSVELETRKEELKQLQRIANDLSLKLEKMDINAAAPPRIRQIQPATVSNAVAESGR